MRKQDCNYCQNTNHVHRCPVCGNEHTDANTMDIHSNLYAAEFMLYAFHFDDPDGDSRSKLAAARSLMMMVAEG